MTGNKQALEIVLNNDRDPGCTEKLAMTRAWGDRYRAEATGYMRRKAYYFKRNFWAMNLDWELQIEDQTKIRRNSDEYQHIHWKSEEKPAKVKHPMEIKRISRT